MRNAEKAWGRVLWVLTQHGLLDPEVKPAERMTREVADLLLLALYAAGNANSSIKARFWGIRSALKVMQPEADTAWLTKPGDWSLHSLLPHTQKQRELSSPGARCLGFCDDRGLNGPDNGEAARLTLRNGLIIAIFASRAPRIRSMSAIRVGKHLQLSAQTCRLAFGAGDMKNASHSTTKYHQASSPGRGATSRLNGASRSERGATTRCGWRRRIPARTGWHRRHDLARVEEGVRQGLRDAPVPVRTCHRVGRGRPDNPGLAAAVLGDSVRGRGALYIQPRNRQAAQLINRAVEDDRRATRLLARRAYGIDDL